jgi:pyridoxal phosphate enzyme (YggS family)
MLVYIRDNIGRIKERINKAAAKSGRRPNEITLVAVSKTFPAEAIRAAVEYGLTDIGESRIQEAEPKLSSLGKIARWHMIGHLQSNKARKAVRLFDMIQSIDSIKLAETVNRHVGHLGRKIDCLLEVNSSGENAKYGFRPEEIPSIINTVKSFENINLCGLMTIGPFVDDDKPIRKAFRITKELYIDGREKIGDSFSVLSMGMSDDFEIAIEEGSNMVRIGTAIFGSRPG